MREFPINIEGKKHAHKIQNKILLKPLEQSEMALSARAILQVIISDFAVAYIYKA